MLPVVETPARGQTQAMDVDTILHRALDAHRSGRLDEAETLYRRTIDGDPGNGEAWHLLGVLLHGQGDLAAAEAACRAAIAADPDLAETYGNLGAVLLDKGEHAPALDAMEAGLARDPGLANALVNRVLAHNALGRTAEAVSAGEAAVSRLAKLAPAHNALGVARLAAGDVETAAEDFARAGALDPELGDAANNLGTALTRLGRLQEAMAAFARALALKPGDPGILANRGAAHLAAGRVADALADFETALAADPGHADARWNRGIARLLSGDLERGFADYEARWSLPEFTPRHTHIPPLTADGAEGGTVLVHAEQGYGDTICMIRYAALLAAQGVRVVVETHPALVRLVRTAAGVAEVVERGQPLPGADLQAPVMSLPLLCGTRRGDDIPASTPYLAAENRPAADFGIAETGVRVGLAWSGRATQKENRLRSVPFGMLAPILETAGATFYSLQVEDGRAWPDPATDLARHVDDFADTAAALMHLDLVITVDTAVAHLAGALGRPAWVLLSAVPDWRYGLTGAATPWYPTLTLYRQPAPGDWDSVIRRVAADLAALIAA